ncbi:MAG: DsbA family oxidoreductase [Betaproteobacteria bacterium]|nr:DsbA family oxidoreductase [Betaproteobacteria bacterium]
MDSTASSAALTVDVVSDVVCPWCYIGKRHLEAALARLPGLRDVAVRWHPFELNPDLPAAGVDRRAYLEAKFGGEARAAQIYERVRDAGRQAGIGFALDAIARQPNTRDAHRLVAWAQASGDAQDLVERLFRAYFVEGRFVGDRDVLVELAAASGYDAQAARAWLDAGTGTAEIAEAEERVRRLGITGVPFFIFAGRVGLSGAHPPESMVAAIRQALDKPSSHAA